MFSQEQMPSITPMIRRCITGNCYNSETAAGAPARINRLLKNSSKNYSF
jgi:hypothetical protein